MESSITTTEKNYVSTTNTDDNQSLIDDTEFPQDQDVENYYDNEDDTSSKVQPDANTERVNLLKKYKEMLFNNECKFIRSESKSKFCDRLHLLSYRKSRDITCRSRRKVTINSKFIVFESSIEKSTKF